MEKIYGDAVTKLLFILGLAVVYGLLIKSLLKFMGKIRDDE